MNIAVQNDNKTLQSDDDLDNNNLNADMTFVPLYNSTQAVYKSYIISKQT